MRAAIAAVSTTRCSGAIVVAISMDCATLRVTMMPPRFDSDACAVGFDAAWASAVPPARAGPRRPPRVPQPLARRDQHGPRVGIVLRLRHQIGGDPVGAA